MTQTNKRRQDQILKVLERWAEKWNLKAELHFGDEERHDECMGQLVQAFDKWHLEQSPKKMSAETAALLGMDDPVLNTKLKAESDMIDRAERAMKKTPNWNAEPWKDYHKQLVEKEEKTGFTIEQFMKWWNSDDFRKQQNIWLKPSKINEFWVTAMSETETTPSPQEETEFQKATEWTQAPRR